MEKLGKKIKRIRKEKKLTQENLDRDRPSHISQIELGLIKKPTVDTLNRIADILDLELEELIINTDYKIEKSKKSAKIDEFAISQSDIDCIFDESGGYIMNYKTYPLYNSRGEKNEFCPFSGDKLITKCHNCGRHIEFKNQEYCIECGHSLIDISINDIIYVDIIEMLSVTNIYDVESLDKAIHSLSDSKAFLTNDKQCLDNLRRDIKKINSKEFQKKYEHLNFEQFRTFAGAINIGYSPMIDYKTIFNGNNDKTINSAKLLDALSRVAINLNIVDIAINYYKSKLPSDFDYEKRNKEFEERLQKDPAYQAQLIQNQKNMESILKSSDVVEKKESIDINKVLNEFIKILYEHSSEKEKKIIKDVFERINKKNINIKEKGEK